MKKSLIVYISIVIIMFLLSCLSLTRHDIIKVSHEDCLKYQKYPVSFQVKVPNNWEVYNMASAEVSPDNYLELVMFDGEEKKEIIKLISFGYFQGGNTSNEDTVEILSKQLIASFRTQIKLDTDIYEQKFIKLNSGDAYSVVMRFESKRDNPAIDKLSEGSYMFWMTFLFNPRGENGLLVLSVEQLPEKRYKLPRYLKKSESYRIMNSVKFLKEK